MNLITVALNYLVADFAPTVPTEALRRQPSADQASVYRRIALFVTAWLAEPGGEAKPLGRNSDAVHRMVAQLEATLASLQPEESPTAEPTSPAGTSLAVHVPGCASLTSPLNTRRLQYGAKMSALFDLSPHLRPDLRIALLEPSALKRRYTNPNLYAWARVTRDSWQEVSKLLSMWLAAGRLFLAGGTAPPFRSAVPFNGARDSSYDRQLLDQRGINGSEQKVWNGPSKRLPAGS